MVNFFFGNLLTILISLLLINVNIGNAKLVRIYNGHASDQLVTVKSGSDVVGTVTLVTKEVVYLMKLSQETIEVGSGVAGVKAVSVAYSS